MKIEGDFDNITFEDYFRMDEPILVNEKDLHNSANRQIVEDVFLHLMYSPKSEIHVDVKFQIVHPLSKQEIAKTVPILIFNSDIAIGNYCHMEWNTETKELGRVFICIHPTVIKTDNFNMNRFIQGFFHELGHIMYFLKYGKIGDEDGIKYKHHCDSPLEKFCDLVSLFALGSLKKFKAAMLQCHGCIAILNPDMQKEWVAEGKYRATQFDEAVRRYPEQFSALGLAV